MKRLISFLILVLVFCGFQTAKDKPLKQKRVIYIIGDSTVKNGRGDGSGGLWGWGDLISPCFDTARIRIENHAMGGTSSRTFRSVGLWDKVLLKLKPGDFVLIQFGHNDGGPINDTFRARGSIKGNGKETEEIDNLLTHKHETVHTYGWYIRQFIKETKEKKAIPLVFSPIPRNDWSDGKVQLMSDSYTKWAKEAADAGKAGFIDLNWLVASKYETLGKDRVKGFFPVDHTHTNKSGARLNALTVAESISRLKGCRLAAFLSREIKKAGTAKPIIKKEYIITQFNAVGDSKTVNTKAIQSTIDECYTNGGGVVVVPSGTFLTGAIFLKQGVDLRIEKGGILKGTTDMKDYPVVATRWEGEEKDWTAALVNVFGMHDFRLYGDGMIDGSGEEWVQQGRSRRQENLSPGETYGRPRLIAVQNCIDSEIIGLNLKDQACWCLFILYSENISVRNLTIRAAHNIPMSDGIDIDSSNDIYVTGCDIDVNDDCIAIKSGKDEDGRRVNKPAQDIMVENCTFRYGHGGVSMGSEVSGGIRNVTIQDCVMEADNWAPVRFKCQPSRGGVVENITYRNIQLKDTRKAFEFNMEWRMVNPKPPSDPLPVFRNVKIINVSGVTDIVGDIHGLNDSPVQNVVFENCNIAAKRGFVIDNVEGLDLSGLKISVQEGEPFIWKQPGGHQVISDLKTLSEGFKSPDAFYGPSILWGWEGPVSKEVIIRDLDRFKSLNIKSLNIEAGYDLPAEYLSDGYFDLIKFAVEHAKQRGMVIWMIDECKYPSGFAGGKFSKERPDLRMQGLDIYKRINVSAGGSVNEPVPPAVLSAVAVNRETGESRLLRIGQDRLNWTAPEGNWQVSMVRPRFRTSVTRAGNNPTHGKDTVNSLCDYLNPAATRQFIQFTHEQYKKHVGNEFGKTFLGFRGDEPDYGFVPWTPALPVVFMKKKGYDVRPWLAAFTIRNPSDSMLRVKADYWDIWSGMFGRNFFKVQADWCAANKLSYMVHLNHEEKMMALAQSGGDFFEDLRHVQIPGIDAIWNQIWPGTIADFPKYASSVAHVYGRHRSMSESFAAYRTPPDVKHAKWVTDHQLVRGINLFEWMYWSASTRNNGIPKSWFSDPEFPQVALYTSRISYLLSNGKPAASVAVYYPTSSEWLGFQKADSSALELCRMLLENQYDFDFVDDYAILNVLTPIGNGLLNRSGQTYQTVLVPSVTAMSRAVLDKLKSFASSGFKVIFTGRMPSVIVEKSFRDARNNYDFGSMLNSYGNQLFSFLPDADFKLEKPDPSIKYNHRKFTDGDLYFVFNEGDKEVQTGVTLSGKGKIQIWDAISGEIKEILPSGQMGKNVQISLRLPPWNTQIILISK